MTEALAEFDGSMLDGLYFVSRVYTLFESIRAAPGGASRLRRRPSRVEKKLLEELMPIARYVLASYRPGRYIAVQWVDGSQSYDAELKQEGAYVNESNYPARAFLEVVCAVDPREHLIRELLDTKGIAFSVKGTRRVKGGAIESVPTAYSNRSFVHEFSHILLGELRKKAAKPYPENTSLIVQATLNLPYSADEWQELVALVQAELPPSRFREIFLYETLCSHSHTFWPAVADDA